jgi:hypothetical protein
MSIVRIELVNKNTIANNMESFLVSMPSSLRRGFPLFLLKNRTERVPMITDMPINVERTRVKTMPTITEVATTRKNV